MLLIWYSLAAEVEIGLAKDLVEATRAEIENREMKDITSFQVEGREEFD